MPHASCHKRVHLLADVVIEDRLELLASNLHMCGCVQERERGRSMLLDSTCVNNHNLENRPTLGVFLRKVENKPTLPPSLRSHLSSSPMGIFSIDYGTSTFHVE